MRFSISTWNYLTSHGEQADLFAAVAQIIGSGFGVELFLDWPAPQLFARANWPALAEACRGSPGLSVHSRVTQTLARELVEEEIELCQFLGQATLVVHPRGLGLDVGTLSFRDLPQLDEQRWQEIGEIVDYAEARGVCIALENGAVGLLKTIRDRLRGMYSRASFGICIDTGHANLQQHETGTTLSWLLEEFRDELVHLHLHDNYGASDEHRMPGDGEIDWSGFLPRLVELGFEGQIVFEIRGGDPLQKALAVREYVRAGLAGR